MGWDNNSWGYMENFSAVRKVVNCMGQYNTVFYTKNGVHLDSYYLDINIILF